MTDSTTGSDTHGYAHAVPAPLRGAVEPLCTLKVVEFRREGRGA